MQAAGVRPAGLPRRTRNDDERDAKRRYDGVKGSAVNPVLREGNSDGRAPKAVSVRPKAPAQHGSVVIRFEVHVAHMVERLLRIEKSHTVAEATDVRIVFNGADGTTKEMKGAFTLQSGKYRRRRDGCGAVESVCP